MLKIQSGIPIPPRRRSPGRNIKYPWQKMTPGDSFFVGCKDRKKRETVKRLSGYNRRFGKFTIRAVIGGVRVWRVE